MTEVVRDQVTDPRGAPSGGGSSSYSHCVRNRTDSGLCGWKSELDKH